MQIGGTDKAHTPTAGAALIDDGTLDSLFTTATTSRKDRVQQLTAGAQESRAARADINKAESSSSVDEWIEAFDAKRGKKYYYHATTREVRWQVP